MNEINFLMKSLVLGYAIYNNRTKNRYWLISINDGFRMICYNEETMSSMVSSPEEDLSNKNEWMISQPEKSVEFI